MMSFGITGCHINAPLVTLPPPACGACGCATAAAAAPPALTPAEPMTAPVLVIPGLDGPAGGRGPARFRTSLNLHARACN